MPAHRGDGIGANLQTGRCRFRLEGPLYRTRCHKRVAGLRAVHLVHEIAHSADDALIGVHYRHVLQRIGREICAEGAGFDNHHLDAERRDLLRQGLRHAFERELRRGVGTRASERKLAAEARHVDDRAAPLPAQMRQYSPGDGQGAEEIGLYLRAEFGLWRLLNGTDDAIAGIVDENVDAAKAGNSGGDSFSASPLTVTSSLCASTRFGASPAIASSLATHLACTTT